MTVQITTKNGDKGFSSLFSGEKILKSNPRMDAYGDIDELVSLLGVCRSQITDNTLESEILNIQKTLFLVGAELATTRDKLQKLKKRIDAQSVKELDQKTSELNQTLEIPPSFIVPGGDIGSAYLDLARSISRRCERKVVALYDSKEIDNEHLIIWINRLSDYLWLLARKVEKNRTLLSS